MLHNSRSVGDSAPYWLSMPFWAALGTGMVKVIGLWNLRRLGSMVTMGLTATRLPNILVTISDGTSWAWKQTFNCVFKVWMKVNTWNTNTHIGQSLINCVTEKVCVYIFTFRISNVSGGARPKRKFFLETIISNFYLTLSSLGHYYTNFWWNSK